MDLTIIGFIGSTIVLIAFLLNQYNRIQNTSVLYDFLNFLGSILLLLYAVSTNSIPFIIVNTVWSLFSLKDVLVYLLRKK